MCIAANCSCSLVYCVLSCVCFCYLVCIGLLRVYCCLTYFSCRIAGQKSVSGRSCYRPPRHKLFQVYKRMLRWFPRFQVATICFSCSPPDLNLLDSYFIFMYMHNNHCHRVTAHLQLNILLLLFDMDVSCHRPFLPGTSLEPAVIPTTQASSFTLQYFLYYV